MSIEIDVTVKGFDKAIQRINMIQIGIESDLTIEELTILAERTLELAQETVPFRTGALKASLQIFVDPNTLTAGVGTDIGYGKYVELGTSKMSARPFLIPALFQALNEFKQRYPQRLKEMSRVSV